MTDKPDLNRLFQLNEPRTPRFEWFHYIQWTDENGIVADGGIDPHGNVIVHDPHAWVGLAPQIKARVRDQCAGGHIGPEGFEMSSYVLLAEIARLRLLLQQSAEDAARGEGC